MQSLLKAMNCDLQGLWIARLARDPLLVSGLLLPVWCVVARTRFLMTRLVYRYQYELTDSKVIRLIHFSGHEQIFHTTTYEPLQHYEQTWKFKRRCRLKYEFWSVLISNNLAIIKGL